MKIQNPKAKEKEFTYKYTGLYTILFVLLSNLYPTFLFIHFILTEEAKAKTILLVIVFQE